MHSCRYAIQVKNKKDIRKCFREVFIFVKFFCFVIALGKKKNKDKKEDIVMFDFSDGLLKYF